MNLSSRSSNADLQPSDLANVQRVSQRLLKLARDTSLWRMKCYEDAPFNSTRRLTIPLPPTSQPHSSNSDHNPRDTQSNVSASNQEDGIEHRVKASKRAIAIADWDPSYPGEKVDWYSEYVARNAQLTASWIYENDAQAPEIRGLALSTDSSRAVGPLENGELCIWDISQDWSHGRRHLQERTRTLPGFLFEDRKHLGELSTRTSPLAFTGVGECIALDSTRSKVYVAVADLLNEIDLDTLHVISQNKYAWPITALSQDDNPERPLTVGTNWSLHIHDARVSIRKRSRTPEDIMKVDATPSDEAIAFLPNYTKVFARGIRESSGPDVITATYSPRHYSSQLPSLCSDMFPRPRHRSRLSALSDYAQCEPGPLSIVHSGGDNIFIAGRFPSILSYDRRYFPKLAYVIHSGARLSALTTLPFSPHHSNSTAEGLLLACGEYNGRGSLELYSLPHLKQSATPPRTTTPSLSERTNTSIPDESSSPPEPTTTRDPWSYKNRQQASPGKLLSVAPHGTRIVFSDAEGGVRWVERDGRALVRRWNVNAVAEHDTAAGARAGVRGEEVVRKIVPCLPEDSGRGVRADGDLLVWTGDRVGVIGTRGRGRRGSVDGGSMMASVRGSSASESGCGSGDDELDTEAETYSRIMRRALERQADERRWMSRFGLRH